MTNITPVEQNDVEAVELLTVHDPVLGYDPLNPGAGTGPANKQAQALANTLLYTLRRVGLQGTWDVSTAALPAGAAPNKMYLVSTGGSYAGYTWLTGDIMFVVQTTPSEVLHRLPVVEAKAKWWAESATAPSVAPVVSGNAIFSAGSSASASGDFALALGNSCTATASYTVSVGHTAEASATEAIAIGRTITASGATSIAIGKSVTASFVDTIAMGRETTATADYALAIGSVAVGSGNASVALGRIATASAHGAVAIGGHPNGGGNHTQATAIGSVAIGGTGVNGGNNAARATASYAIAIGGSTSSIDGARGAGDYSVALGTGAYTNANSAVAIGLKSYCGTGLGVSLGAHSETVQRNELCSAITNDNAGTRKGHWRLKKMVVDTTNATPADMSDNSTSGGTATVQLQTGSCGTITGKIAAYQTGGSAGTTGDSAGWEFKLVMKRIGSTHSLVGSITTTAIAADAAAAGWAVSLSVSSAGLQIQVTGEADKNIRWFATADIANTE